MLAGVVQPVPYCDFHDMENRLSAAGVNLRNDDNPPSVWGNAILRASTDIDKYLIRAYDAVYLVTSFWVADQAANIAVYKLCGRRGNPRPASIVTDWKQTIDDLKEVRAGGADVPHIPRRRQAAPVMSNLITRLSPVLHTRVHSSISPNTGGTPTAYPQFHDFSKITDSWISFPLG